MRRRAKAEISLFTIAMVVTLSFGVYGAKPPTPPPDIPLSIAFNLSPQPGVYGDGLGLYVHDIGSVTAYISGTCDQISFRTKDANWVAPRTLTFDFTGYTIDTLGIETAAMYSSTKPQQNPCSNDLRSLGLYQSKVRYTYIDWQNAQGEYRLRWSDVSVTCTGLSGPQCSQWTLTPTSTAEVLKVVGVRRGGLQYESRGFYAMPFEMMATAQ